MIAQAIPSYFMSCFHCFVLSDDLCNDIEGIISKFYWGGDVAKRFMHWVKWDRLRTPKNEGGLGFKKFKSFNLALVAKNWWRIMSQSDIILSLLFKVVCAPHNYIFRAKKGYRSSSAGTRILRSG